MVDLAQSVIEITDVRRLFRNHRDCVTGVAVFPNRGRMVTSSYDKTLCLWNLKDGMVLKKMEGHSGRVEAMAVSGDGKLIASGDSNGELIAWDGDTGKSLTKAFKAHSGVIYSLDFSPDSAALATVSWDKTIKLWRTDTWRTYGNPINVGEWIHCVRFSPSGHLLAIVTLAVPHIQIWNPSRFECVAKLTTNSLSLAWTPDGTRLLSGGNNFSRKIREWDTSTWKQVGDPWVGHTKAIRALAVNSTGTLLASASHDNHVRLWRISGRRTVAIFRHSDSVRCVTFSVDDNYILCGGFDNNITVLRVPEDILLENRRNAQISGVGFDVAEEPRTNDAADHHYNILSMNTIIRNACVTSNLSTAQELLSQQINLDWQNYNAYANRSFVLSRKCDWDNALHDALQSLSIEASLPGYVSKGIAHCGKLEFSEATKAFDLAFMFASQNSTMTRLILLAKAIALFNANQQDEAMQRVEELANICPGADAVACQVVEAYLHIQLGIKALNDAYYDEAADHFTDAISSGVLSNRKEIHSNYEIFIVLFGWDLTSSWQVAHQNRCRAFLQAGKLVETRGAYRFMMDMCDEETRVSCIEWSTAFKKECGALNVASADIALAASEYDRAIELYSAAIDLDAGNYRLFASRCKAKLGKMLWEEALTDVRKVIELNPRSYLGFQLKYAALHGAKRYPEAIDAFEVMHCKLDGDHDPEMQALRQKYISPSNARAAIQTVIGARMEDIPPRLLDTSAGRLCNREAQIYAFNTSPKYDKLLSSIISQDANLQMQHIQDTVAEFFSYVMLSHRWERKELSLHEIQDKAIYELNSLEGIIKLQSFCKTVQDSGYRWAWIDTCCIDQKDNVELQRSVNSMFAWYRRSALTIIYLSDVPPSSQSGAMGRSVWTTRGWTVQEFLAPKIVYFLHSDWTLYLGDRTGNHKESDRIMRELEDATGIIGHALRGFCPGMKDAREKLQWASMRVTTLPEDTAYSLFGIFGVHLPVIYGENKQNALGRLLQEIIAQSGDISCLYWTGKSSEFNSSLPASISSYMTPPFLTPPLSEDDMRSLVSSLLRDTGIVKQASQLYATLHDLPTPRFAQCRLHLPCIVFTVTQVALRPRQNQETHFTYEVKAKGLQDILITTENELIPFSRQMSNRQKLILVRPWDRGLLEQYDFRGQSNPGDDVQSIMTEDLRTLPSSPVLGDRMQIDSESGLRALRLIVGLGQPFRAFLLAVAQQWGREYNRVAADHDIVAQVKHMTSVGDMMDVRTLEIL